MISSPRKPPPYGMRDTPAGLTFGGIFALACASPGPTLASAGAAEGRRR
jgi:hypothetical protein